MAQLFGVEMEGGDIVHCLGFSEERHIGNSMIRALHGGVTAAFLELSAQLELAAHVSASNTKFETINAAIDYVASAKDRDLKARVEITRLGRRIAFTTVRCWQDDEAKPVATAQVCLRLLRLIKKRDPEGPLTQTHTVTFLLLLIPNFPPPFTGEMRADRPILNSV